MQALMNLCTRPIIDYPLVESSSLLSRAFPIAMLRLDGFNESECTHTASTFLNFTGGKSEPPSLCAGRISLIR